MNFEVNTTTKVITLLEEIKLTDIELLKKLLDKDWENWKLSFKPLTIEKTSWIPVAPEPVWSMQPYYVGDLPGTFGRPNPMKLPEIWCNTEDHFKVNGLTEENIATISLHRP